MIKKLNYINGKSGQSAVEYLMLMGILLSAVMLTNFFGRFQHGFEGYFNTCSKKVVDSTRMAE